MYDRVYALKDEFPQLNISINGGVKTLDDTAVHLEKLDGVMIGREVYSNPYILADVDRRFYQDDRPVLSREEIVHAMLPYVEAQMAGGARAWNIARHMLGLFQGQPGGRIWRRYLSQHGTGQSKNGLQVGPELLINALAAVDEARATAKAYQDSRVS